MNMTKFLTKRAWRKYTSINDLWKFAKVDFKIKPFKTKQEFTDLLSKYLTKHRNGTLPNGKAFYAELVFRKKDGSVRIGDRNVGIIMISNPM